MPVGWPREKQEIAGELSHRKRVLDPASCLRTQSKPHQKLVTLVPRGTAAGWAGQARGLPPSHCTAYRGHGPGEDFTESVRAFPFSEQSWIFLSSRESH